MQLEKRTVLHPLFLSALITALSISGCTPHPPAVAEKITLEGRELGGLSPSQVDAFLAELAQEKRVLPRGSRIKDDEKMVIPARWGYRLNRSLMKKRLLEAPFNAEIECTYELIAPRPKTPSPLPYPIRRAAAGLNSVGLMINVAWGEQYLDDILSILRKHGATATFFLLGCWAERHPEIVRRLARRGHEVAAHGYRDCHPRSLSAPELKADLRRTVDILSDIAGVRPVTFTPHYGEITPTMLATAEKLGMETVLWTADTADWLLKDADRMLKRVKPHLEDGCLILTHPTEPTLDFLRLLLPLLDELDLEVTTCKNLLTPTYPPPAK